MNSKKSWFIILASNLLLSRLNLILFIALVSISNKDNLSLGKWLLILIPKFPVPAHISISEFKVLSLANISSIFSANNSVSFLG